MVNPNLKLNPKLFDTDVESVPIRNGFGEGLLAAAHNDERIVGLCADLTSSTRMNHFADAYPERFFQVGVAEQNLASMASGMAAMGKIPWTSSYAMFHPGRSWEQIRTTICYNDVPVKIAGSHAGVSVGPDGGTHQAIEDIALMRVLPRMTVVVPCDAHQAKKATLALSKMDTPAYLRLARNATAVVTTTETPFEVGKAQVMIETNTPDVGIIVSGTLTHRALLAAKELMDRGTKVTLLNLHTIKPLDEKAIVGLAQTARALVTVEEHQRAGGMGSAIAELLAQHEPVPMEFVAVNDTFGQSGTQDELIAHYKLDTPDILEAVERVIERKSRK